MPHTAQGCSAVAAVALVFPAAAWLLKYPLCGLARVSTTDYWGNTICGSGTGDVRIETRMLLIGVVLLAALAALPLILWRIERRQDAGEQSRSWIVQLLVPVGFAGLVIWWLGQNGSQDPARGHRGRRRCRTPGDASRCRSSGQEPKSRLAG